MATMTIRNLPDDVHHRIRILAAKRGISAEAAVRELLDEATRPTGLAGDSITEFARTMQVDFPGIERDQGTLEPARFE